MTIVEFILSLNCTDGDQPGLMLLLRQLDFVDRGECLCACLSPSLNATLKCCWPVQGSLLAFFVSSNTTVVYSQIELVILKYILTYTIYNAG